MCVKQAIEEIGIIATEPKGFRPQPEKPNPNPKLLFRDELHPQHELPIGQDGAAPISHNNLILLLFTDNKTPVNPDPDIPPLFVKIVTV